MSKIAVDLVGGFNGKRPGRHQGEFEAALFIGRQDLFGQFTGPQFDQGSGNRVFPVRSQDQAAYFAGRLEDQVNCNPAVNRHPARGIGSTRIEGIGGPDSETAGQHVVEEQAAAGPGTQSG